MARKKCSEGGEDAAKAAREAYAMAEVLKHYHASPAADEAPLRLETLFAYCDLMGDRMRVAMRELNHEYGYGKFGEGYATAKEAA